MNATFEFTVRLDITAANANALHEATNSAVAHMSAYPGMAVLSAKKSDPTHQLDPDQIAGLANQIAGLEGIIVSEQGGGIGVVTPK